MLVLCRMAVSEEGQLVEDRGWISADYTYTTKFAVSRAILYWRTEKHPLSKKYWEDEHVRITLLQARG